MVEFVFTFTATSPFKTLSFETKISTEVDGTEIAVLTSHETELFKITEFKELTVSESPSSFSVQSSTKTVSAM